MRWQKMDDHYFHGLDFVAFDTETTGLWAPAHRIVEIGAIKFRLGQSRFERFQALVNPQRRIPLETIGIHGITDTMVKNAATIADVLGEFLEFAGPDSIWIAHNAPFDISFMGCEMDRVGIALSANPIIDTVDVFRRYFPGLDSYSLLSLAQKFRISRSQSHRADDDAILVWKLFSEAAEKFPYISDNKGLKREFTLYSLSQWQGEQRELPEQYADFGLAVKEGLRMEIVYQTERKPPQTRIIRPVRVFWNRARFYIAAYCERVEEERTFRLDRIQSFRLLSVQE
jgi:DNA polymerase-3 subunit epsilon